MDKWGKVEMNKGLLLLWGGVAVSLALLALLVYFSLTPPKIAPETLAYFARSQVEKGQAYARMNYLSFVAGQGLTLLVLAGAVIFLFRRGWVPWAGANPYLQVIVYALLLSILLALVILPIEFYRGFLLEHRFGLSTQSLGDWAVDYGKQFVLDALMTGLMIGGLYFILRHWTFRWPLAATVAFGLLLVLQAWLWPLFIDPLFYKFTPLPAGPFKDRVVELAADAGINIGDVLVMNASRQTTKANAYFTGVGRTKRIVFYDNLLRDFSQRDAEFVVAHEIGHWQHRHVMIGMLLGVGGALIFFLLYRLVLAGYGTPAGHPSAVPLFLLSMAVFSLLLMPVQNAVSRTFERQADRAALVLTHDPAGGAGMMAKLAADNLADVQPRPFIRLFMFSHPSAMERINYFEKMTGCTN